MTQDGQALAELRRVAQESAAAHIDASYVTDDLAVSRSWNGSAVSWGTSRSRTGPCA